MMDSSILQDAIDVVKERGEDYGHPYDDYKRVAAIWSAILGVEVSPHDAALCMIGVKLSRQVNKHKRDNLVDIAGYAHVVDMIDRS